MSNSVRPRRWQPTRLPRPWDSPGKNAGVGCHFLLQCMKVKSEREVAQSCPTLSDPMDCSPPGSSVHGILQARVLEWGGHHVVHYIPNVTHNWKCLPFDHLHPILPPLLPASGNHKFDLVSMSSFVCFQSIVYLQHYFSSCHTTE